MTIDDPVNARRGLPLAERIDLDARSGLRVRERAGLQVIEALLPGPFRAIFTTRLGGASAGSYSSLNLDLRSADDPAHVAHNRARVAAALADEPLGVPLVRARGALGPEVVSTRDVAMARTPDGRLVAVGGAAGSGTAAIESRPYRLVSPLQVHGVRVAGAADYVAAARDDGPAPEPFTDPADGLTMHPVLDRGLAALLLFADCVPIVLVGDVDMAVVHGGWRGILGGVIEQAGCSMTGPPALAVIGPSLGPCCFTVGRDVADGFTSRFGAEVVSQGRVDLWAAATAALREVGLVSSRIVNPRLCTACNRDLFYSYRVEGPETGRQGCAAWTVDA